MGKKELIINEIGDIPETSLDEVLDFVRFVKMKNITESGNLTVATESSLQKDWLKPEEDEAWRNL